MPTRAKRTLLHLDRHLDPFDSRSPGIEPDDLERHRPSMGNAEPFLRRGDSQARYPNPCRMVRRMTRRMTRGPEKPLETGIESVCAAFRRRLDARP